MAKKWIQAMHMKKGALHKALGVPQGKKIPAKKMAGKHSGKVSKMIALAKTLQGFKK